MSSNKQRILLASAAALTIAGGAFLFSTYFQVLHRVHESATGVRAARTLPVAAEAVRLRPGPFSDRYVSAGFISAAVFRGDLYVCTRGSLQRYSNGVPTRVWWAGRDFPPDAISGMAVRQSGSELWLQTESAGIVIFDGSGFRTLVPASDALRHVTALLPLSAGEMLIGTRDAGVYISDGQTWKQFHPSLAKLHVTAVAGSGDGLWVGTRDDGAFFWRAGTATRLNGLPDTWVLSIASDAQRAWIGTPAGIAEFQGTNLNRELGAGVFASSLIASGRKLWVGTADQGLLSIPLDENRRRIQEGDEPSGQPIHSLLAWNGSVYRVDERSVIDVQSNQVIAHAPPMSLTDANISSLLSDSEDKLWIGYFNRGLDVMSSHDLQHRENELLFCVNRIKQDTNTGYIGVGTANGLAIFDKSIDNYHVLDRRTGLISNNITDFVFQPVLTVATPAGISYVDGPTPASVSAFEGLASNHVYTLLSSGPKLYAGTLGGISVVGNRVVSASYNAANSGLRHNWITASAHFGEETYFGTYGSGVVRLSGDGIIHTSRAFTKTRVEIGPNAMLATDRALYAGTAAQGLAVLRRGDTNWRFISDGLPSLNVTALAAREGKLYVGTDSGLVSAHEEEVLR